MNDRVLAWDGFKNARDLGGLETVDGRVTRRGMVVRSDTPTRLTPDGWAALYAYGIRTIVTLRTYGMTEPELDVVPPYPDVVTLQAEIEDITDQEFVAHSVDNGLWATPLYYHDALRRWPGRHAVAISAIARAQPGGVLFHCIRGNDRTGIITLLLLSLVEATTQAIIADYELSADPVREQILQREGASVRQALLGALEGLDVDAYLLAGGATPDDLAAIRARLTGEG